MTQFNPNPYKKRSRSDGDVLFRGILCVLIGLSLLVIAGKNTSALPTLSGIVRNNCYTETAPQIAKPV